MGLCPCEQLYPNEEEGEEKEDSRPPLNVVYTTNSGPNQQNGTEEADYDDVTMLMSDGFDHSTQNDNNDNGNNNYCNCGSHDSLVSLLTLQQPWNELSILMMILPNNKNSSSKSNINAPTTNQLPLSRKEQERQQMLLFNPYHILQVRRDATPSEIRQAYRKLALLHHPGRRRPLLQKLAHQQQQQQQHQQQQHSGENHDDDDEHQVEKDVANKEEEEEEKRRLQQQLHEQYQKFVWLAQCYECLMDLASRDKLELLLTPPTSPTQSSQNVWVGGKVWQPPTTQLQPRNRRMLFQRHLSSGSCYSSSSSTRFQDSTRTLSTHAGGAAGGGIVTTTATATSRGNDEQLSSSTPFRCPSSPEKISAATTTRILYSRSPSPVLMEEEEQKLKGDSKPLPLSDSLCRGLQNPNSQSEDTDANCFLCVAGNDNIVETKEKSKDEIPNLLPASSSSSSASSATTASPAAVATPRPRTLLEQAHSHKPFSDPYQIFERVFGSQLYPRVYYPTAETVNSEEGDTGEQKKKAGNNDEPPKRHHHHKPSSPSTSPLPFSSPSAPMSPTMISAAAALTPLGPWTGTCESLPNGIHWKRTTTRFLLPHRKLTKHEIIDRATGDVVRIQVLSEDLANAAEREEPKPQTEWSNPKKKNSNSKGRCWIDCDYLVEEFQKMWACCGR